MTAARATAAALALGACAVLSACGGDGGGAGRPELSVSGAYIPQPPMADMAAGYLTVRNTGRAADTLTAVTSPLSRDVTLHTTTGTRMRQVGSLPVPADGELRLAGGGSHLMFAGLAHRPEVGEKIRLTLRFAVSAPLTVTVPVQPLTYRPGG
ncbi:copper chaperone PCu(A)C [Streptomyces sp. B1866]|uniref:copper chaperone PCu(A)C n=1 Tax=Streptomyces sp. B1866 TaxID=3075431 RepID=UPI00288F0196|nr:copper chaperone PCu(A)C [Streptomyces sp. B1866]MDT3398549.1 copper chaperone PCu(A)C [Streptomyces sp. B1866]